MSRLFKRPNSDNWYFEFQGSRISTRLTDKRAAENWRREWERARTDPSYVRSSETLDACLSAHVEAAKRAGRAEGTLYAVRYHAANLCAVLGAATAIGGIDARMVDTYIARRIAGKKPAALPTVYKELTTLRRALRRAKRRGEKVADLDTLLPEDMSGASEPGTRHLTLAQVWALVEYLERPRAAVVAWIVATGSDWASVHTAVPEDVTGEQARVRGTKRAHRDRLIVVRPQLLPLLEIAAEGIPFAPWASVRRDLAVACRALDIPPVTPRDLRRTCGMLLRASGLAPHVIAGVLGNSAAVCERTYARLTPESLAGLLATHEG